MRSKHKIWILTLIVTIGFLARDTVRIAGPIDMQPTYITLFVSFVLSFFFVILTENKKTHNHRKIVLAPVAASVALLSILGAYVLNIPSYSDGAFLTVLLDNLLKALNNLADFGFLIVLAAALFGVLVGSDKNLRTTYSYKSSKHTSKESYKKRFRKK